MNVQTREYLRGKIYAPLRDYDINNIIKISYFDSWKRQIAI